MLKGNHQFLDGHNRNQEVWDICSTEQGKVSRDLSFPPLCNGFCNQDWAKRLTTRFSISGYTNANAMVQHPKMVKKTAMKCGMPSSIVFYSVFSVFASFFAERE